MERVSVSEIGAVSRITRNWRNVERKFRALRFHAVVSTVYVETDFKSCQTDPAAPTMFTVMEMRDFRHGDYTRQKKKLVGLERYSLLRTRTFCHA